MIIQIHTNMSGQPLVAAEALDVLCNIYVLMRHHRCHYHCYY